MNKINMATLLESISEGISLDPMRWERDDFLTIIMLVSRAKELGYIDRDGKKFKVTEKGKIFLSTVAQPIDPSAKGIERWLSIPDSMRVEKLGENQIYLPNRYWLPERA